MNTELQNISIKLKSLSVFRHLLDDPVVKALSDYLDCCGSGDSGVAVSAYSEFAMRLYNTGTDGIGEYIQRITNNDENIYIRSMGEGKIPPAMITESVNRELEILQEIAGITPDMLRAGISEDISLPRWNSGRVDIAGDYKHRTENIGKYGYGIYAEYHMFYLSKKGRIVPVCNPDNTRLSDLADYEREKKLIVDNTKALLEGKPAANILLTGDAGTGKSSTIKAVANELSGDGLRILEVRKEQLREIPGILDELAINPLKFIIFIDDLSFSKDDDDFSALKAILEGSVASKSGNVAIYATSNRRHLVKEKFSDREGDDIHFNDTMQEIVSLSERFGLQITFNRPDKKIYLDIVHTLADAKGLKYNADELDIIAERFALMRGTRSARAAKQFVDSLISGTAKQ